MTLRVLQFFTQCPTCGASVESRGGAIGPHLVPPFTTLGNVATLCKNRWAR